MRQFDALMRTELSFHWQRTLSAVWVSGDWLGDWNGALGQVTAMCVEPAKLSYRWASQGRPRELNTNDIDPSIHPSVTDLTSLQLPILCLTWRQRGLRGNLIQQRRNPRVLLSFLIPGGNSGKHKEQRGGLSTNLKQSLKNKWIYLKEQKKNQKKNRLVRPRKIFRNFFL